MWDRDNRLAKLQRALGIRATGQQRAHARHRRNPDAAYDLAEGQPPYAGLGVDLRLARERHRRSLTDVAVILRIQQRYIEAIEDGRFGDLPGSTYATGFLRTYADFVGLDPDSVVERFREEASMESGPTRLVMSQSMAEPRRPRGMVVILSLFAAAVLYAGWMFLNSGSEVAEKTVPQAPDRLLAMLDDGATEAIEIRSDPSLLQASSVPGLESGAVRTNSLHTSEGRQDNVSRSNSVINRETMKVAERQLASVALVSARSVSTARTASETETAATNARQRMPSIVSRGETSVITPAISAGTAEPSIPAAASVTNSSVTSPTEASPRSRVILRATANAWVQIRDGRRETLLTGILKPGDTYEAPDRDDLVLTVGNAGGLEIVVDGKPLDSLGPTGAVRRNIPLDAEKLLAGAHKRRAR